MWGKGSAYADLNRAPPLLFHVSRAIAGRLWAITNRMRDGLCYLVASRSDEVGEGEMQDASNPNGAAVSPVLSLIDDYSYGVPAASHLGHQKGISLRTPTRCLSGDLPV